MAAPLHGTVICTVVTSNYLHFALALARSVRQYHADLQLVICVVDRTDQLPHTGDPAITFVFGDELEIPQWRRFSFQYTAFELACALKPSVMHYCFEQHDARSVVYLDADMQLYGPLDELTEIAPTWSVVLTPHLLSPLPDDNLTPTCETFSRAGTFNGGFVAINGTQTGSNFLSWWKRRMKKSCVVRLNDGLFVDQRPLDLVPGMFDHVCVYRRPGFHLAYWNLFGQQVVEQGDGYRLSSGQPVTLFHFSGIDLKNRKTLSRYQNRLSLKDYPAVRSMLAQYILNLNACEGRRYQKLEYGYAKMSDGTAISDVWRDVVRQEHELLADVSDPFNVDAYPDLLERLRRIEARVSPPPLSCARSVSKRVETAVKWMIGRYRKAA
jgi:hypothetical protein